jgi:methylated-DNA-[protein]-cysteine S-methyltransferase
MPNPSTDGLYCFPTELGWTILSWRDDKLTALRFGYPSAGAAIVSLDAESLKPIAEDKLPAWIDQLVARLQSYAAGSDERFDDVPLDLSHLSAFQSRVVRACRKIARGQVRSYGELAAVAGSPGAARAVGNVMAQNRYPIIVPCHRVVGSAGALGGFSARDGVNMKRRMLEMEGAKVNRRTAVHA